ncbi:ABC transporter ATP-binding protein [Deinococcus puniceus]|uniref:ABC transporter ATP-binding protein n=1 Tax=Deinococcus puniceus TaxID=1182568 RepID=UPI0007C95C95|nr:ATP-binding cassette domain-containing protein [Deinococcus puniceus]
MSDCAIVVQQIQLLHGLNLKLSGSQIVHLQGANGAGKTTFLRALVGELPINGEGTVGGGVPGSVQARQACIYVPTDVYLPEDLQVHEYLRFMAAAWQVPTEPLLDLAAEFGLTPWLKAWPSVLSRGTRQKVALAAAFGLARPITLLDEPFGTLDRASRAVLLRAIEDRRDAGGLVLSTAHGDELATLWPTVLELGDGGTLTLHPAQA